MNILLSSVGRRPYLVRWFCEALTANGIDGKVIAADLDPRSPSRAFADDFVEAPRVTDPGYRQWLQSFLADHEVRLAVSINDFELSTWAQLPTTPEWDPLVRLTAESQRLVEDKYAMSLAFAEQGMNVPQTWLGGSTGRAVDETREGCGFVVKGRFGSASRGLRFTDVAGLNAAVAEATREVTDQQGRPAHEQRAIDPRELVIVQDRIVGPEYGLDVVCDLDNTYAGVLARRKIDMRSGETDRAESVAADDFVDVARRLADVVPHAGTIDVDVMVDADGTPYVIDVNPRFGGGYPFSHLAGARVPHAYVAWAAGLPAPDEWLRTDAGVVSGKYVETVRII
ncbi:hypothetical protein B841_09335 [Corynebacterium maris DSM 45190]|uniref:ATP-grasp domain-containing protein n=1 Tax=Corynebacterium maris DSM 45190 TaxID=1224163 RepID=S5T3W6_9CORY|nr:ATP-grasp domain-containing protein [Corynebacterium maris]AGS35340.1 hypothetical protein B841_09335 [Corynebacterium maris DSM 45190]